MTNLLKPINTRPKLYTYGSAQGYKYRKKTLVMFKDYKILKLTNISNLTL